jgi:hypothetical protein
MQQKTSLGIFRALAGFVCIYHLLLGLVGTFASSATVISVVERAYGVTLTANDQLTFLTRFASAYMLVFAVAVGMLAANPLKYRNLVWLPVTLFAVRIVERLALFGSLNETFGVSAASNLQVIIPITVLCVSLVAFRPRGNKTA